MLAARIELRKDMATPPSVASVYLSHLDGVVTLHVNLLMQLDPGSFEIVDADNEVDEEIKKRFRDAELGTQLLNDLNSVTIEADPGQGPSKLIISAAGTKIPGTGQSIRQFLQSLKKRNSSFKLPNKIQQQ